MSSSLLGRRTRRHPRNWRITPPRLNSRQRSAATDVVAFNTALGLALEFSRPVEAARMKPYANWTVYPDGSIATDSRNDNRADALALASRFGDPHPA